MARERCSLLVRNLRFETSPDKMRKVFEKYGKIRDVYIPMDHYTNKPKGFGFVQFYDEEDARDALEALDRTILDGNQIAIVIAQDRRKSPETMRRLQRIIHDRRREDDYNRRDRSRHRSRSHGAHRSRRHHRRSSSRESRDTSSSPKHHSRRSSGRTSRRNEEKKTLRRSRKSSSLSS